MSDLRPSRLACDHALELVVRVGEMGMVRGANRGVWGCLDCGASDVVEAVVEEPRPHDVRLLGYRSIPLPPEVATWIGRFPRKLGPRAWVAADANAHDMAERDQLAASVTYGPSIRGFLEADPPALPAPDGLPDWLAGFERALQMLLDARSADLDDWIRWAVEPATMALALDYLAHQPEIEARIAERVEAGTVSEVGPRVLEKVRTLQDEG